MTPEETERSSRVLVHIADRPTWQAAQAAGSYRADSLQREGFIHCSRPDQVTEVANRLYHGRPDLVLLCIDPQRVAAPIRNEALDGPEAYPHIYGPLEIDSVFQVLDFPPDENGRFHLPSHLAAGEEAGR